MNTIVIVAVAAVIIALVLLVIIARAKRSKQLPAAHVERPAGEPQMEATPAPDAGEPAPQAEVEQPAPEAPVQPADEEQPPAAQVVERPAETIATSTTEEPPEGGLVIETVSARADREATEQLTLKRREQRLKRLRQGLSQTRGGFVTKISNLFKGRKEIDASLIEELEEVLITADVGVKTADYFIELVRRALDQQELKDPEKVLELLKDEIRRVINREAQPFDFSSSNPYVIMVVGVNGVGKTTTIGKLATKFAEDGHKIVLVAGDTFRAAAVHQLEIWGERSAAEVIKSKEGADPSSVIFDGIKRAKEVGADIVIADTAGRLHTKAPLMEELKKMGRVAGKAHEGAPHQVILVLDATTGQNALQQVSIFREALELDGIVLTKLDGTAKGGVVIGICHEHQLPVRYIGIGEAKEDLREFKAAEFVDALFLDKDSPEA